MTDHRALYLSRDQVEALELGARFCRALAAVEHAHIIEDSESLESILGGVDRIEAMLTANALQSLALLWDSLPSQFRGGTIGADGASILPSVTAALSPDGEQPSAPNLYPHVVHAFDNWSRKVPCV